MKHRQKQRKSEGNLIHRGGNITKSTKKSKQKSPSLAVSIERKNSNGCSNWEKLSKVLGYQKKPEKFELPKPEMCPLLSPSSKENVSHVTPQKPTKKPDKKSKKSKKLVAMDCEMVGTGTDGKDSMLARVSLVDGKGECIYDEYVKPVDDITDFRTPVSGIRPKDLVRGKDLYTIQKDVLQHIEGSILVGHALKNDFDVLFLNHPRSDVRDTSNYKPFRAMFNGRTPSLKKLAAKLLETTIQTGEHSSVEDAGAAMQIYLLHRREWEKSIKRNKRKKTDAEKLLNKETNHTK